MYVDNILYPVTALGPGRRIVIWTAGCHRHCDGCANPELWEPRPYQKISPERLADMVSGLMIQKEGQVDGLTITGGEPFEQAQEICLFLDLLEGRFRDSRKESRKERGEEDQGQVLHLEQEPGQKLEQMPGKKPEQKPGQKLEQMPGQKPEQKPGQEPGQKPERMPEHETEQMEIFSCGIQVFSGFLLEDLRGQAECAALLDRIDVLIDGAYIKEQNDGKAVLRGSLNQRIHYLNPAMEGIYAPYLEEGRKIENFVYDYRTLSVGIHNP